LLVREQNESAKVSICPVGEDAVINLLTVLAVMMILGGALAVIGATLTAHADAIVAALAGRSLAAVPLATPARVRVVVRMAWPAQLPIRQLRAAA